MTIKPRDYQIEAVNAVVNYMCDKPRGNPLVSLGTGLGKSLVMAMLIRMAHYEWRARVVMMTHNADLIDGNCKEFLKLEPLAPVGVYSATLKRKQTEAPILFCGIQSVARAPEKLGHVDLLLVDEVHTIGYNEESQWRTTINALKRINPNMRMVGLSATLFRMGTGGLTDGDNALFDDIVYEYGLLEGVRDGWLCEPIPKEMALKIDLSGVHKRGGEFIESELQEAVNKDEITKAAIKETMQYGANRRTWMIFCTGVEHCKAVCAEIRSYGISCEVVTGDTPQAEREAIYARLKSGELRSVCSVAVMTTGTNIPCIDMIVFLRPTENGGLLVQMTGRGTRTVYAPHMPLDTIEQRLAAIRESTKPNCLLLDFAGNLDRHGPIDLIKGRAKLGGEGIPPMKVCECGAILHIAKMVCPDCGFVFPPPEKETIKPKAAGGKVLSTQRVLETFEVTDVTYREHQGKDGKPNTLCVSYEIDFTFSIKEWVCIGHPAGSFPRRKAVAWWNERAPKGLGYTIPNSAAEAIHQMQVGTMQMSLADMLRKPCAVVAEKEGKFWRIERYIFDRQEDEPKETPLDPQEFQARNQTLALDDDIPF